MKLAALLLVCLPAVEAVGGGALRFGGQQQVLISPIPGPGRTDRITIEAWINYKWQFVRHNRILSQWSSCLAYSLFIPWEDNESLEIEIGVLGRIRSSVSIPAAIWVHVAGTYDGRFVRLFLDGEPILEVPASGIIPDCPSERIAIGSDQGSHCFLGMIDEVRLWSIARTREEIARDRFRVLHGDEEGLEGYWRFEEGEGQIAADSSANGRDGILGRQAGTDDADPSWVAQGAPILEISADDVEPPLLPTAGCEVCLHGTGFDPGGETEIRIEGRSAPVMSATEDRVCFLAPPHDDGSLEIEILTPLERGIASLQYRSLLLRGDVSGDGVINLGDPIRLLNHLFANGTIDCQDAADGDDDGKLTIGDAIGVLGYLFADGLPPRRPFPAAGSDPTPDGLYCGW